MAGTQGEPTFSLFLTGHPGWFATALLQHFEAHPETAPQRLFLLHEPGQVSAPPPAGATRVVGDLADVATYRDALASCTHVVHAAGLIHPRFSRIRDYQRVNVAGTRALAQASRTVGGQKWIFLSSNAAGGVGSPLLRESDGDAPRSPYGKSKKAAEEVLSETLEDVTVLRPCMFYGPPVPERHLEIFRRIETGWMPLFGEGRQPRSMVHVENLVQAVLLALRQAPAKGLRHYYVADAEPTTYRDYVETLAKLLGTQVRWRKLPTWVPRLAEAADQTASALGFYIQPLHLLGEADWNAGVSIEKARRELGYTPQPLFERGLRDSVAWYRSRQASQAGRGVEWKRFHADSDSYRKQLVGPVLDTYVLPKYLELFERSFEGLDNRSFLEVGAGNGDTTLSVLQANAKRAARGAAPLIASYRAVEVFEEGVQWLRGKGIDATLGNAEALPFESASFDHCVAFDVIHHVDHPERMAREMMRVARGKLLLTESNGLSVPRKLLELLPNRRAAGERSYTPWRYRSFFMRHPEFEVTAFKIRPFLFVIGVPRWLEAFMVRFSEWAEKIPLLKWQCSTVLIEVEYRVKNADTALDAAWPKLPSSPSSSPRTAKRTV